MPKPSTEELVMLARELRSLPHSGKGTFIARHAATLRVTPKTLYSWINDVTELGQRKPRNDKGESGLTQQEAYLISALLKESARQTGKRLNSIGAAVAILRANHKIRAEHVNKKTGEVSPLSEAAIARALMAYGLHPDQLNRPTPAQSLRTPHPNYLWQIDASLCVMYYLPRNKGLSVMDRAVFYHNKPGNLHKIENDRVWRYVVTDHASGTLYVEYVYGGESGENLANIVINAMQYRGRQDPFHGVPYMVMLDPGSANTGYLFKNLCQALGVRLQINEVGNPRAKGQVENAHNLVERGFEQGLKLARVQDLAELNTQAWRWMQVFNGQSIHRRHGMTRYAAWARISADQLMKAPSVELCQSLSHEKPETRVVNDLMQINWKGEQYDVGHIPDLSNRDKIEVARNPWKDDSLRIIMQAPDGTPLFYEADKVQRDDFGFDLNAPVVGNEFKSHADTPTVQAQKLLEQITMEASTQAEAEGKRKAKTLPFGGTLDPYKPTTDAEPNLPDWMEKRGQASPVASPTTHLRPFTWVEAAKQLRAALGQQWTADSFAELKQRYPEGVPQDAMPELITHFSGNSQAASKGKPTLRVIGGH